MAKLRPPAPDPATPPSSLFPELHPLWAEVVRDWPSLKTFDREAALEEVVRRAETKRQTLGDPLFKGFDRTLKMF